MDERQVLELMRDVFMCEASWNVGLIAEINRRLAALTEAAQADREEPTLEECEEHAAQAMYDNLHRDKLRINELECIAATRSLMLRARPAPSHALVDALDAARSFVQDVMNSPSAWCGDFKLHTSQHGEAELKYILGLLDAARASLPAAKKEGGA